MAATRVAETAPHTRFPLLPVLVRLLADFARPSPLLAALVVALTVVGGLLPAAGIWASRGLIDAALALIRPAGTPSPARALAWAAAVLATGLLGPAAANLSITAGDVLRARQRGNLMAAVLRRAATDPLAQTESGAYQDAAKRARDSANFQAADAILTLTFLVEAAVRAAGSAAILTAIAWPLPLLALGAAVPVMRHKVRRSRARYGMETALTPRRRVADYLAGLFRLRPAVAEARVFGFGTHLLHRWHTLAEEQQRAEYAEQRAEVAAGTAADAALSLGAAAAMAVLALRAAGQGLAVGSFVAALAAASALQGDVEMVLWTARDLHTDLLYARDMYTFCSRDAQATLGRDGRRGRGGAVRFPSPLHVLACQGVTFTYPGADRPALDGVDLTLRAGERVALVGDKGAGRAHVLDQAGPPPPPTPDPGPGKTSTLPRVRNRRCRDPTASISRASAVQSGHGPPGASSATARKAAS